MPKRVVKFKLVPHARMERYRLRTRKEIKRFINARIANAMAERKSSKNVIKTVREKPAYWLKPKSFMVIYKMTRDNERVFASVEEAENMLSKEIGPVKMEPMWNGVGFAIVPKEQ